VETDPDRRCIVSTALDGRITDSSVRLSLVTLLSDAFQDGVDRHRLTARYGVDRRIVRIALQYQQPRELMRRTPDPIALLAALDDANLTMLNNMLSR
jgi:hypothetical protein